MSQTLTIRQVRERAARILGRRPGRSTVLKWMLRGMPGPEGAFIKLPSELEVRPGSPNPCVRVTTVEALDRYLTEVVLVGAAGKGRYARWRRAVQ